MAAPSKHGPGYPGVPMTPRAPTVISAAGILPKAGSNKPAAHAARMPSPIVPIVSGGKGGGGGKAKTTSAASAKKGTFGARMGF